MAGERDTGGRGNQFWLRFAPALGFVCVCVGGAGKEAIVLGCGEEW